MFDVKTGESMKYTNFPGSKFMQLEFALGSKKFFLLEGGLKGVIRVIDFEDFLALKPGSDQLVPVEKIKPMSHFEIKWDEEKRLCEKGAWYIDNTSIFVGTLNGEIIHLEETGKTIKKAMIHNGGKIKGISFD